MVLLRWVLATGAVAGIHSCEIADIFMRTVPDPEGNVQPIDVYPDVADPTLFWAMLDYRTTGFYLEAYASPDSCTAVLTGSSTVNLDPGSRALAEVVVQDTASQAGGDVTTYHVNVSRMTGRETLLDTVMIGSATMVPAWDPAAGNFTAYLNVEADVIKVFYRRLDSGQEVTLTSMPQEALPVLSVDGDAWGNTSNTSRLLADEASVHSRRLVDGAFTGWPSGAVVGDTAVLGEVQHWSSDYSTLIDVGHQRVLNLSVVSADQTLESFYVFTVKRPFCPAEKRFFDGGTLTCTDMCNEGFFGNAATGRCSACLVDGCMICQADLRCTRCAGGLTLSQGSLACVAAMSAMGSLQQTEESAEAYTRANSGFVLAAVCAVSLLCCGAVWLRRDRKRRQAYDTDDEAGSPYGTARLLDDDS